LHEQRASRSIASLEPLACVRLSSAISSSCAWIASARGVGLVHGREVLGVGAGVRRRDPALLGLNQIDRVTQQNTAAAEQTSSSAVELSSGAGRVTELVNRFRLADEAISTDGAGNDATAPIPDDWADRAGSEHHA
jgi:hypothetical protein